MSEIALFCLVQDEAGWLVLCLHTTWDIFPERNSQVKENVEADSGGKKMYLEGNTFHLTDSNKAEAPEWRTTSALRKTFSIPIMILTYLSFNITNFLWEID